MSGTSADGVDIALTQITGHGLDMQAKLLHHHHRPYNAELRSEIFAFRGADGGVKSDPLPRLAKLGREISLTYAAAVNEALSAAHLSATDLSAVAAHGQTLYHDPPNTIQWLDPSLIAAEVGSPVVSDFRRADLAAGGQGAPLVPFADYILFRHPTKNRVLLNIGGIANITWLPANCTLDQVVAFDTGPGNCISDYLCRIHDPTGPGYDVAGATASRGNPHHDKVRLHLLSHEYFSRRPPKSTDGPEMIQAFESLPLALQPHFGQRDKGSSEDLPDLLAMADLLTALTIQNAMLDFLPAPVDEIISSGGGTANTAIMRFLDLGLAATGRTKRISIHDVGIAAEAKEAIAFALLGAATLDGIPSNVPSATGARKAVVLGSITPRP